MTKLNTDFRPQATTRIFTEFRALVGQEQLSLSLDKIHKEISRRKLVSHALIERFAIPIGLRKALDYRKKTGRLPKLQSNAELFAACTFAAGAVETSKMLSESGKQRLGGMIRDALSLDSDARRLQHEFTAAAHFSLQGWDITPVDLEDNGNFDFIVSKDELEVDIECKTISRDKGNPIHLMDALNFMECVHEPLLEIANSGCRTVDITFDEGLPKNRPDQVALAAQISKCMRRGGKLKLSGAVVEVTFQKMPPGGTMAEAHKMIAAETSQLQERLNGHVGSIYNSKRALVLGVSSARSTKLVEYCYDVIKKGCGQLSKCRAGCVWTHFIDLTDNEMKELVAENTQTAFDGLSRDIFKNVKRKHVSALSYSAESSIKMTTKRTSNSVSSSFGKQGILPTHYNQQALYPLSINDGFP